LPALGQQFAEAGGRLDRQPLQDILEIGIGIVPIQLRGLELGLANNREDLCNDLTSSDVESAARFRRNVGSNDISGAARFRVVLKTH
jgi:hypothetical protein